MKKRTEINPSEQPTINADTDLLKRGCLRKGFGSYDCPTVASYHACQIYQNRGSVKDCSTPADLTKQAAMETELFGLGCNRFLDRPDQFLCKTQKSFDACESYRKKGETTKCLMAK